jgi:hypothetical protein
MQEPGRLGLLGALPTLWESNTPSPGPGPNDTSNNPIAATPADDLARAGWPISKSGAPYVPSPPQPSISPSQWLDLARLGIPNIVDYFTKPAPPLAPFPSAPGKIPPADANPYFGPALVEAANLGTAALGAGEGIALGLARLATKAPVLGDFGLSATKPLAARSSLLARPIAQVGQEGEEAVGIPQSAPKPSIKITSSDATRYPDRVTELTLEEVKNVKRQALTQQLSEYLEYAQENGLTFILHTRPDTVLSGPLKALIDAGHLELRHIRRLPK